MFALLSREIPKEPFIPLQSRNNPETLNLINHKPSIILRIPMYLTVYSLATGYKTLSGEVFLSFPGRMICEP